MKLFIGDRVMAKPAPFRIPRSSASPTPPRISTSPRLRSGGDRPGPIRTCRNSGFDLRTDRPQGTWGYKAALIAARTNSAKATWPELAACARRGSGKLFLGIAGHPENSWTASPAQAASPTVTVVAADRHFRQRREGGISVIGFHKVDGPNTLRGFAAFDDKDLLRRFSDAACAALDAYSPGWDQ